MEKLRQKRPRVVLVPEKYSQLRTRILQRDGWKCQSCGSPINLQVHHMRFRGRLGSDVPDNLITLCADCHSKEHHQN
jgi:5-methylcytosine-specific restriction endonuclease McrA